MVVGGLRVSRWVLALEMALCFVPLTFGWFDVLFGMSGVAWLNVEVIQRYFIGAPGGITILATLYSAAILGALGPLGLLVALRLIALGRGIRSRLLGRVLVAGPILLGVIYIGGNVIVGGPQVLATWVGGALLLFVLPMAGAAHLVYLGRATPRQIAPQA
jgi:hypothetical protein